MYQYYGNSSTAVKRHPNWRYSLAMADQIDLMTHCLLTRSLLQSPNKKKLVGCGPVAHGYWLAFLHRDKRFEGDDGRVHRVDILFLNCRRRPAPTRCCLTLNLLAYEEMESAFVSR